MVIDDLRSQCPNIGVACLYADYKDQTNQTLVHILGSFLHQFLTTACEPIPDEVIKKLQDIQRQRGKVGVEDNLALLRTRLRQLKCAFICIDAVDELEPNVRQQLLVILKELGTNTRLFLTGRDYIECEVQNHFEVTQTYTVVISARRQDIQEFVEQQIKEDHYRNPKEMDEALAKDIVDAIVMRSQGMYVTQFKTLEWRQ